MEHVWRRSAMVFLVIGWTVAPSSGAAQQAGSAGGIGSVWITPYLGVGIQGDYYNGVVQFSDGGTDLLAIAGGTAPVLGVQLGYRFRRALTIHANLSTASPNVDFVEDGTPRPDVDVRTTQFDLGLLYDVGSFPVAGRIAPIFLGGGATFTFHSLDGFQWDDNFVQPGTTSIGFHGFLGFDVPVGPRISIRGQGKLSVTPLALGDLEEKIAIAEGGGVTAQVDGGTQSYFVLAAGVTIRL